MKRRHDMVVRMVPIEQITVVNTRSRGKDRFKRIVSNIANIGLKKPITLARRESRDGKPCYDLVCGEGRLEAFKALGQMEVPALIVEATREELLLMSLTENIARRSHTTLDMAREIGAMKERGYKPADIARKVDLDISYVTGILRLLKNGDQRLIVAVEHRRIPLSIAIAISESDDQEVQKAMADAYERGELRGKSLFTARRLLAKKHDKEQRTRGPGGRSIRVTASSLLEAYKKEAARQQLLVSRNRQCETRLRFIVTAIKKLLADESLVNLLRAEGLTSLPQFLSQQVQGEEAAHGK